MSGLVHDPFTSSTPARNVLQVIVWVTNEITETRNARKALKDFYKYFSVKFCASVTNKVSSSNPW